MTPFGKMLRQERKDRGMLLGQMADKLGISTPYASQLETGVKPATPRVLDKIVEMFDLSKSDAEALTRAAAVSQITPVESVTINLKPDSSKHDRELASHLAMSFNRLSPEAKRRIRDMLKDSANG
jgi:transcriptional regulator with XRE-family HTH domain